MYVYHSVNNNLSHYQSRIGVLMKLSQLEQGKAASIVALTGLTPDVRKKLMVMGMLPKTEVTLIRRAPMGDPLQVEVRGVSIAIRESIAEQIEVI
ncbi:putative Fe2+ transport system protein A (modular protein) [Vibrio coralliirubri]|nr:putative Fe2+ transport system protein A (modular protein) [Vibrio coralliirubri]